MPATPPNQQPPRRRSSRLRRALIWTFSIIAAVFVVAIAAFLIWANVGVMAAEPEPLASVTNDPAISVTEVDGTLVLSPSEEPSDTGLVFIPGAKVEPSAYAAKLSSLVTDDNMTVVIPQPLLNLAFFDTRTLDDYAAVAPEVTTWSVGGHSLGGVRACQLAESPDVAGLLLFGSYCANDLAADESLDVLSITGSADGLSTPQKAADARGLLPADAETLEIEGANHAMFGNYGPQSGDGTATIPDEDGRQQIAAATSAWAAELQP
ncbi:alpha/beta hydrolase [Pseudoclavibacter sp. 8L]|uniref:alpha/beta hydrolase n=1 Tax=Pseudoclavibacter sp. 8L TaxID=2653162 RepID=UPI0012EF82B5|nr:alpha/beta hydrolase [Pseudoclavibacter sp. 8L]VXA97777.1 Alpha/beta hydrolase [Pseudoclavibacter sp. 8L]